MAKLFGEDLTKMSQTREKKDIYEKPRDYGGNDNYSYGNNN